MDDSRIDDIAVEVLAAADDRRQIGLFSADGLDLAAAYRVAERVTTRRIARGERPVGWKIGFTNRTIWDEYQVHAPIWAPMYDTTVSEAEPGTPVFVDVGRLVEPRLEPEIALRLSRVPEPGMRAADLISCIDGVAHGFELVQSLYPGWKFAAADTVAAFALHGRFVHGPFAEVSADGSWAARLEDFSVRLFRDGVQVDHGHAHAVLGGPLHALAALVEGLAAAPFPPGLRAGDIITTGTVTRAFPALSGETWRSEIEGLPLPGMTLTLGSESS